MWCFRLILWGAAFVIVMIPGFFLAGIVGRVAGFRPGSKVGQAEQVFGWIGAALLGSLILGICLVTWLIDWAVSTAIENAPVPQQPTPKPIPADWDEQKMAKTFLSDMQEFDARVGWGNFGKMGKLGYNVFGVVDIKVNGTLYPNAISMHPPTNGHATVKYRLNRTAKLFIAHAALSDVEPGFAPQTPATFGVHGDNQLLWVSNPIQQNGVAQKCRLSVDGVDVLELQVHCPGSNSHVRGVWLDPHVLK